MTTMRSVSGVVAAMSLAALASVHVDSQQPAVQIPQPGVPEIMTLEGKFVRVAYNNEGYVILGYQIANRTIGDEWIMLDVGITLMERVRDYTLTRDAVTLDTPDGVLRLPSIEEYRANETKVQPLQNRLKVQRDSIDYFPPWTNGANRLGFFSDLGSRALPWDQAEVTNSRACLGQLYFHMPGGTKYGQYWLNVKFAQSVVRVPFRLFTAGRGKEARQELRQHQKAGRRRVPQEGVNEVAGGCGEQHQARPIVLRQAAGAEAPLTGSVSGVSRRCAISADDRDRPDRRRRYRAGRGPRHRGISHCARSRRCARHESG